VVRRGTQKLSLSCKIYFVRHCSHGNFRTVEDISQRDAVSRVRETVG